MPTCAPPGPSATVARLQRRYSPAGIRARRRRRAAAAARWLLSVEAPARAKRAIDILLSLALLALLAPVALVVALALRLRGPALVRTPRLGRWCDVFIEYSFRSDTGRTGVLMRRLGIHRIPVLINVLRGDMSFVGPRPVAFGELSPRLREVRRRHDVRPGLLSLRWVRRRANVDYGSEVDTDLEYVNSWTLRGDLGLALRAIPAVLLGERGAVAPDLVEILGMRIHNLTMSEAIGTMVSWLDGAAPRQVSFVNAHCGNIACRDAEYLESVNGSDLCLADGIGVKLAGRLLGRPIKQNVNGTDLFPRLCEALAGTGRGLYLLGGRSGVAEGVREWVEKRHGPSLVRGSRQGYFSPEEEHEIVRSINASGAEVLLVALGVPAQELWIRRHIRDLEVKVAMGVGGLFDFYSGRIRRAPAWMRELGLEWVYRLSQEPGRMWKRYLLGNFTFMSRVLLDKATGRSARRGESTRRNKP